MRDIKREKIAEIEVLDPNRKVGKSVKRIIKKVLKCVPDSIYLRARYWLIFKKKLNLKNPKTYNEKLQWMKIYDRNPLYNQLVDKYEVRNFIAKRIGEEYLIPCLGVWNRFDDINFEMLPDQFVLKCTHDSGSVFVCRRKELLDKVSLKKHFDMAVSDNQYYGGREWAYKDVRGRIIAEKLMIDNESESLKDYKFFCFDGKVKAMFIATDRGVEGEDVKFDFFDREYNHLPFRHGHENAKSVPVRPDNYEQMVDIAERLAENLRHVRIDLYNINGQIYFGEMTFYHHCGFVPFVPEEWDEVLGGWLDVS